MSIPPLGPAPRVPASAPPGTLQPASPHDPVQRTKSAASGALPPPSKAIDKKKGTTQGRNLWIENGEQIASQLKSGKVFRLSIGSHAVTVRLLKPMGSGRYHDAFLVEVDGNEPMILKLPNWRMQNLPNQGIAEILKNELLLYKKFKAILDYETNAGRVAMFHDLERHADVSDHEITGEWANAHLTHGFHLVEYIPNEFPLGKKDGEIPMKGDGFLAIHPSDDALSAMFRAASFARMEDPAGKTLCVNLQRDNIRMDNDGILVLIDPQPPNSDKTFEALVEKFLATFSPPGSDRYRFLDPRD
jgi:hypothetical protein